MNGQGFDRRGFLQRTTMAVAAASTLPAVLPAPAAADHSSPRGNRYGPQKRFVDWRFGMFLHFNMGTFHDMEWVNPNQDPMSFNPTALDCGQWADAARAAGMRFAVLTAKHHDGFCLWPSRYTDYDVMSSGHRRDIVREYVEAFRSRGVTPCLYFSIWDRTNGVGPPVWDEPAPIDLDLVKGQLTELLTRYGPVPLLIFDGWAWHPRLGHKTISFGEIRAHVASLQPDCLVLDLNGLTVPWDSDLLFIEEPKGNVFVPEGNTYAASQGVSVSPAGWFWHPSTPSALLTPEQIVDGHLRWLEPNYCTFILNIPPNPQGLLDATVVETLRQVGSMWRPDRTRPPLPAQPDQLRYPVTPTSATATSGDAAPAIDGHSDFGWNGQADQTLWQAAAALPQSVTLDLGRLHAGIDTLTYLPRQDTATNYQYDYLTAGNITAYRVEVSLDGSRFHEVARGTWPGDHTLKRARFRAPLARYIRLEARATVDNAPASASEINVGGTNTRPRTLS
ncbi:MAG TPA: alpha-L-fucosidase [Actinophytocola sp.]|uniref:alpha-L-fucosidase n=1 Tax=Actinophytocola sp. TaxID=1872138 RepID=UPI002DDD6A7D|nr:alpha-L-fucosidase [Actinophytocola sp.]HEV2779953.1 alpha-L-fucosidase [Actinophytocola sp.]